MQEDFHYYAAYCAAILAGYPHADSLSIAYADQFVDCCTETYLKKVRGPMEASTTQSQPELAGSEMDHLTLQKITRIWASFHFLPFDLYATLPGWHSKGYLEKYRLICKPNGDLLVDTVERAKGKGLEAAGVAMHTLSDTWAHTYFAGTPSLVINNAVDFYDMTDGVEKELVFGHNPTVPEDVEKGNYVNTPNLTEEKSIMVLGHGRAGHLPDYSFFRYKYMPAWGRYEEIYKDNPADYYKAFCQMVYALQYLRGEHKEFVRDTYADRIVAPYRERVMAILEKRQINACEDWKAFGEELSGEKVRDFDSFAYEAEYRDAGKKDDTFLGRFFRAAIDQKSMVTNRIYRSGSKIAGISVGQDGKKAKAAGKEA